jgi:hypothetical protein
MPRFVRAAALLAACVLLMCAGNASAATNKLAPKPPVELALHKGGSKKVRAPRPARRSKKHALPYTGLALWPEGIAALSLLALGVGIRSLVRPCRAV